MTAYQVYETAQQTERLATELDSLAAKLSLVATKRCNASPDEEAERLAGLAEQIAGLADEMRDGAENQTVRDLGAHEAESDALRCACSHRNAAHVYAGTEAGRGVYGCTSCPCSDFEESAPDLHPADREQAARMDGAANEDRDEAVGMGVL